MKMQPTKVVEVENEGLVALLGQTVTIFCNVYIYTGKLVGVNDSCIKLEGASIVYDTGPLNHNKWLDAQKLPGDWYVSTSLIESFGILK